MRTASALLLVVCATAIALCFLPSASAADGNDEYTNASALAPGITGPYDIDPSGDDDWYSIVVATPSTVRIQLNGTIGDDAVLYLYDANISTITYDYRGGFPQIETFLPGGIYYAYVREYSDFYQIFGYYINLTVTPAGMLAEGLNGPYNSPYSGAWSWFAFDVVEPSTVRLQFNATSGYPYMELYDQNVSYITYSYTNIQRQLYPGSYFAVMQDYTGGSLVDFYVTLERVSLAGIDGNGIYTNATPVSFGMNGPFDIDPIGDLDYYVISMPFAGIVDMETNGSTGYTVMTLYDQNLSYVAQDYYSGHGSFSRIQAAVEGQTYYILVQDPYGSYTFYNYTLEITLSGLPAADGNDDQASADELSAGTTEGFTLVRGDEDWYSYTATIPGTLRVETNGPYGGTYIYIYDEDQSYLGSGSSTGNFSFQVASVLVDAGHYFILVETYYSISAVRDYNVTITFTPWVSVDGNDFRSQAQRIVQGLNGPWSTYSYADTDWYYFDTQQDGAVQVDLYAAIPYYYYYPSVALYNETGSYIDGGNYQVTDNGPAARYYLQVSSSSYPLDWYYLNLTYDDTVDPVISISGPANGTQVDNGAVRVSGTTERGAHVWINGTEVLVDVNGSFSMLMPVELGTNVFTVLAVDAMGNDEQTVITVTGIDRNESLTNQLNNANQQLATTQGQLTNTQQQLAAAQAAQAAAAAQASSSASQLNQSQLQLEVANGSVAAARAEADAQRGIALMGMVLAGVGLAAAVALAVMMVRRRPPQMGPPVQQAQYPPQAPVTATYPVQPPTGGAPTAPDAPWPPQAPASPPASPPASGPSTGQSEHMGATAPALAEGTVVDQAGRPFGRGGVSEHIPSPVHLEGKSAGADVPVDAGM